MAKLKAPNGCTSCSTGGEVFAVKKGYVTVPDEAVSELIPHGFITEVDNEAITAAADEAAEKEAAEKEAEKEAEKAAAAEAANQGGRAQ